MLRVTQLAGFGGRRAAAAPGVFTLAAGTGSLALAGSAVTLTYTPLPPSYATFNYNISTDTVVTGGLTVNRSVASNFAGASSAEFKSAGKWYFEIKTEVSIGASHTLGIINSSGVYSDAFSNGTNSAVVQGNGNLFVNNAGAGSIGAHSVGAVFGVAVDLTGGKVWFRKDTGSWNGSGTADPATNTGGITLPSASYAPFVSFVFGATGDQFTANFGATSFANAAPSGFTAGWTT